MANSNLPDKADIKKLKDAEKASKVNNAPKRPMTDAELKAGRYDVPKQTVKFKKGGKIDGCATKGKTKYRVF